MPAVAADAVARLPRLQHQVVVNAHQATSQDAGVESFNGLALYGQRAVAIGLTGENVCAPVITLRHVVDGADEFDAQRADHRACQSGLGKKKGNASLVGNTGGSAPTRAKGKT